MNKFVNVRLPILISLFLCGGVAAGLLLYYYGISALYSLFITVPAAIIIIIYAAVKRKILKIALFVLLPAVAFIGGAFNTYFRTSSYDANDIKENIDYSVHGTVTKKGNTDSGEYIIIGNITLNGKKADGNMYVYLGPYYGEFCDVGYTVDFISAVESERAFEYGKLNTNAEDNVKYSSSVFAGLQSTYHYSFIAGMRNRIKGVLYSNLYKETAAVCYAMLIGDTGDIERGALDSFRYGGVAHIFAVSGLHIGIIYAIISFILKKLRVNRYVASVIDISALLFYCWLCGFSLSAVRATIMCAVAETAKCVRGRYDGMNALAIAVFIILSITPLSLFSPGFQLSVCAIGGIHCFSKLLERLLVKIKTPQSVASAVGASFGAQIGTTPIMLSSFGYISGAGLLLNIVVIPVLSVAFSAIFITTFICAAIPAISAYILPYAVLPIEAVMSFFISTGFDGALISGFGAGAFVPLFFLATIFITDKINFRSLKRLFAVACSALVLAAYVMMRYSAPLSGFSVIISGYGKGGEIIMRSAQGTVLIVTDDVNISHLKESLNENYIKDIDALVLVGEDSAELYGELGLDCKNVYICYDFPQIQPYPDIDMNYADKFSVCGIDFEFRNKATVVANVGGIDFAVAAGEFDTVRECDVYVSDTVIDNVSCNYRIFFGEKNADYSVYNCGDIKFTVDGGTYRLLTKIPPRR